MIDKRTLFTRLNQCVSKNMGHALFSLFLMAICETIVLSLLLAPAAVLISQNEMTARSMALVAVLSFVSLIVVFLFQYGFAVLLLRMERSQYVTLGYIFNGFKTFRTSFPVALVFTISVAAVIALCRAGVYFFKQPLNLLNQKWRPIIENSAVIAVMLLFLMLLFVRFLFVFQIRYDNQNDGVFSVFKKSMHLISHHVIDSIRFILRAGGFYLLIALIVLAADFIIPEDSGKNFSGLSIVSLILDFIYFVNGYTALVRMYLAVPVLYDSLKNQAQPSDSAETTLPPADHPSD